MSDHAHDKLDLFKKLVPSLEADPDGVTLGDIIVLLLDLVLLVYTGYRSWHFLEGSMPPEYKVLALTGLWGLDVGAVAWSLVWIFGSTTRYQDWASMTMFVVDLIGMFLTSLVDSLTFTGGDAAVPPLLQLAALYGVPVIVLGNVVVGFIYHMTGPATRRKRAERQMREALQREREQAEMELRRKRMQVVRSAELLQEREALVRMEAQLAQQKIRLDGVEKGLAEALDDTGHVDGIARHTHDDLRQRLRQFAETVRRGFDPDGQNEAGAVFASDAGAEPSVVRTKRETAPNA